MIDIGCDSRDRPHNSSVWDNGSWPRSSGTAGRTLCSLHRWWLRNGLRWICLRRLCTGWSRFGLQKLYIFQSFSFKFTFKTTKCIYQCLSWLLTHVDRQACKSQLCLKHDGFTVEWFNSSVTCQPPSSIYASQKKNTFVINSIIAQFSPVLPDATVFSAAFDDFANLQSICGSKVVLKSMNRETPLVASKFCGCEYFLGSFK